MGLICIPYQGTVESLALKEPKERTKMLEFISQSKEFAAEYCKKKEALLKAKDDTQFHFNKKKSATAERKQMFKDKFEVNGGQNVFNKTYFLCFESTLYHHLGIAQIYRMTNLNSPQHFKFLSNMILNSLSQVVVPGVFIFK